MTTESQSRVLPANPSLDHLRKEARHLLDALRTRASSTQLADAQLMVARSYGFTSWRSLKFEVDQRRQAPGRRLPAVIAEVLPRGRQGTGTQTLDPGHAEQVFFGLCGVMLGLPMTVLNLAIVLDLVRKIPL